jgi:hypothetical protein
VCLEGPQYNPLSQNVSEFGYAELKRDRGGEGVKALLLFYAGINCLHIEELEKLKK